MDLTALGPSLLRTIIDHLPDTVYVKDLEGHYILDNAAHMRLVGAKSPEEVLGKTVYDFFPAEMASRYDADDQRVIRSDQALLSREEPMIDRWGSPRWVVTSKVPLHDKNGKVIGLVAISRDITRRKRVEEERDRFFELTLDLLCITGFDGFFKQLNPAWEAAMGFTTTELMGAPLFEFVHPDDREEMRRQISRFATGQPQPRFENRFRRKDGSYRWLSWSASPSVAHRLIYGVARDVTERRQSEEQLRAANAELARSEGALRETMDALRASHEDLIQAQMHLIQADKLDSVGRLAAGVAHEVKNPLAILLMGVDYLSHHDPTGTSQSRNVIRAMRDAIHRADTIVRGLVDFSAARQLDLHPTELRAIVEQSMMLVKHELVASHVHSEIVVPHDLPLLHLDVNKMQQVFVNVFMNAIHAMPRGGTLSVRACSEQVAEDRAINGIRLPHVMEQGQRVVVVKVEDTGHGIAPEKLTRVFEPFFTTKPPGKGTGLGMTVTRKIIELHGGVSDICNRPEGGVAVTFILKTPENGK